MEQLDKALQKEYHKHLSKERSKISINNINDIIRAIGELDPKKSVNLHDELINTVIKVHQNDYKVSANTVSKDKRTVLLEGLETIKRRLEPINQELIKPTVINGKTIAPIAIGNGLNSYHWVDAAITQWLGGKRDQLRIYWDLNDGFRYYYDIWEHHLTKVKRNEASS